MKKIVGILVVYSAKKAPYAVSRFREILKSCSTECIVRVVSNNQSLNIGDIRGTNINAEFSGWDEGIASVDVESADAVVLANDTFCTRRDFGEQEVQRLKKILTLCSRKQEAYIAGELNWSINYGELKGMRKFLIRWIRTSFFVVSPLALKQLSKVGLPGSDSRSYIELKNGEFMYARCVPALFQDRIDEWLIPVTGQEGWYRAREADSHHLLLKAKCVLQELCLVERCERLGIEIVDWDRKVSVRWVLLRTMYCAQKVLPRRKWSSNGSN